MAIADRRILIAGVAEEGIGKKGGDLGRGQEEQRFLDGRSGGHYMVEGVGDELGASEEVSWGEVQEN